MGEAGMRSSLRHAVEFPKKGKEVACESIHAVRQGTVRHDPLNIPKCVAGTRTNGTAQSVLPV
jgi:hypothetical protein